MSNVSPLSSATPVGISESEWQLRQKLALCYRIFDHLNWTLVIFNHLTVRVPGPEHHFLINPFGLRYDEGPVPGRAGRRAWRGSRSPTRAVGCGRSASRSRGWPA